MRARGSRTERAIFFIGSMRERTVRVHQRCRNQPAQYGERYVQSNWKSSLALLQSEWVIWTT